MSATEGTSTQPPPSPVMSRAAEAMARPWDSPVSSIPAAATIDADGHDLARAEPGGQQPADGRHDDVAAQVPGGEGTGGGAGDPQVLLHGREDRASSRSGRSRGPRTRPGNPWPGPPTGSLGFGRVSRHADRTAPVGCPLARAALPHRRRRRRYAAPVDAGGGRGGGSGDAQPEGLQVDVDALGRHRLADDRFPGLHARTAGPATRRRA